MAEKQTEDIKILLSIPEHLSKELQEEADQQFRPLNNYIRWVLIHRHKNKPE